MRGNDLAVGTYSRPLLLTIAVTFWSVRLAGFLFYRVLQTKTDKCAPVFHSRIALSPSRLVCGCTPVKRAQSERT